MNYYDLTKKSDKLTVVCMLWGEWCAPLGIMYVNRLYNMVQKHLSIPHDFICFTDRHDVTDFKKGITVKELPFTDMILNFPKFYLYHPDNGLGGRILYIDLDSVIIDSIDEMASYDGDFCGVKPFNSANKHTAGGLLSFEAGYHEGLWNEIRYKYNYWKRLTKGNERFVYEKLIKNSDHWQDLYPGQFVSYRIHCKRKKAAPPDARFIAFYASQRPHIAQERWIRSHWKV